MSPKVVTVDCKNRIVFQHTGDFDSKKLLILYATNPRFRYFINSGHYMLVQGKVVPNSPNFITFRDGHTGLYGTVAASDPAFCRHYMAAVSDRRFSPFRANRPFLKSIYSTHQFRSHINRPSHQFQRREFFEDKLGNGKVITSFKEVTCDNIANIVGKDLGPGEDFSCALKRFMRESQVTTERLSEFTGLSSKTIQRMRVPGYHAELPHIIALCVGLHLDPYNGMYLVHLSGYELTNSFRDKVYRFILSFAYQNTVYDCNLMLIRLGLPPLTRLR